MSLAASAAAPPDPCPPPLSWRDVIESFRDGAEAWRIDRPRDPLHGRTIGQGPPLYLLGGFGGTPQLYALLVWLLREEFRCVLIETRDERREQYGMRNAECGVRGHFAVRTLRTPHSTFRTHRSPLMLENLTADLWAAADHFGDKRFGVFASSFGGLVALAALAEGSHRIEGAVLQ
ncbi:MAG: alpha/beta fold hydrolase, partial [Planctomycetaceae bacterium]